VLEILGSELRATLDKMKAGIEADEA